MAWALLKPYRSNGSNALKTASIVSGRTPRSAAWETNCSFIERRTLDFFLRIA